MTREEAIQWLEAMKSAYALPIETYEAIDMAIEALQDIPQSEQYKKGFEDAKRAFLVEYARESKNMRGTNAAGKAR